MALVLPQASTAFQLRVVTSAHEFPEVVSPRFCTVAPLHVSDAVGAVNAGIVVPHSKVASLPALPIVGAVVSITEIVWLRVTEWFPLQSVASHVRVSE